MIRKKKVMCACRIMDNILGYEPEDGSSILSGRTSSFKRRSVMLSVKDMVKNSQQVEFVKFDKDELWYKTESGFEFPVPTSDTGAASFMSKDKAILFMRWIKKHLDSGASSVHNSINNDGDVQFVRYQQGELWYVTQDGFEFPVSVKENTNIFYKKDISTKFTNWIKTHFDSIESGRIETH